MTADSPQAELKPRFPDIIAAPELSTQPDVPWFSPGVPEPIRVRLIELLDFFQLHDWQMWVYVSDDLGAHSYEITHTPHYRQVHLKINEALSLDDQCWERELYHECIHLVHADYMQFVDRIIATFPKRERKMLMKMHTDMYEKFTERWARILINDRPWEERVRLAEGEARRHNELYQIPDMQLRINRPDDAPTKAD